MSVAFMCEVCGDEGLWRIDRVGDAVCSWACAEHLHTVWSRLQRRGELTQLRVTHSTFGAMVALEEIAAQVEAPAQEED